MNISYISLQGDDKPEVSRSTSTSDTGFDEFMDMSSHGKIEKIEKIYNFYTCLYNVCMLQIKLISG